MADDDGFESSLHVAVYLILFCSCINYSHRTIRAGSNKNVSKCRILPKKTVATLDAEANTHPGVRAAHSIPHL